MAFHMHESDFERFGLWSGLVLEGLALWENHNNLQKINRNFKKLYDTCDDLETRVKKVERTALPIFAQPSPATYHAHGMPRSSASERPQPEIHPSGISSGSREWLHKTAKGVEEHLGLFKAINGIP